MVLSKKRGCKHNPECEHFAGRAKCRAEVEGKGCNPPTEVRVQAGLPLRGVDAREFGEFLRKSGGVMPIPGFTSKQ